MQVQRTHKLIYRFVFRWSFMGIPQGTDHLKARVVEYLHGRCS